jgi:hypothetical protein
VAGTLDTPEGAGGLVLQDIRWMGLVHTSVILKEKTGLTVFAWPEMISKSCTCVEMCCKFFDMRTRNASKFIGNPVDAKKWGCINPKKDCILVVMF